MNVWHYFPHHATACVPLFSCNTYNYLMHLLCVQRQHETGATKTALINETKRMLQLLQWSREKGKRAHVQCPCPYSTMYLLRVRAAAASSRFAIKSTCNTRSPDNIMSWEALNSTAAQTLQLCHTFFPHSILVCPLAIAPSWNLLQLKCKFPCILNRIVISLRFFLFSVAIPCPPLPLFEKGMITIMEFVLDMLFDRCDLSFALCGLIESGKGIDEWSIAAPHRIRRLRWMICANRI